MTDFRAFTRDELPAAFAALELAFGGGEPNEADAAVDIGLVDPAHSLGAFDGATPIVTTTWFDLAMTIPGGTAPVSGVSWVSVSPLHRRQGLLRRLMTRQLTDLHEQGRQVAALWASESAIYQRFGYGPATWQHTQTIPRAAAFLRPVEVTGLRFETPTATALGAIHDRVAPSRPGWFARAQPWWDYRLHDPSHRREGASPLRCVVDGEDGYALYATTQSWGQTGPDGAVHVHEVVAGPPASEARLWRFLLDLDLMSTVKAHRSPVDAPLLQLLADPRSAQVHLSDALWVRLVDVAGLAQRSYDGEIDIVLDVTDEVCPWNAGTWRLSGGPAGAVCERTTDPADLALDVRDLGSAFLGGTSLAARARAGWVRELTPGALAAATTAFGWSGPAAHCPLVF